MHITGFLCWWGSDPQADSLGRQSVLLPQGESALTAGGPPGLGRGLPGAVPAGQRKGRRLQEVRWALGAREGFKAGGGGRGLSAAEGKWVQGCGGGIRLLVLTKKSKGSEWYPESQQGHLALGWRMLEVALNKLWLQVPVASPYPARWRPRAGQGWESQLLCAGGTSRKLWEGSRCVQGRPGPASLPRCDGQVLSQLARPGPRETGLLERLPTGLGPFLPAPNNTWLELFLCYHAWS